MAKGKSKSPDSSPKAMRPGLTPEAEENQCISLAMNLVKKRLQEGTASSQEVTHFLKLGSTKAVLENEKLIEENKLLRARTKALEDSKDIKELYAAAIKAMASYSGHCEDEDSDDY
ncbi:MAG: hypothetical protein ACI4V7_09165 [Succinivibrionaceae bacterium]